jgi:uncharacterized protein YjiS (DUF1127 family)
MELSMKKIYLVTVIAIVVTIAIASHLLAVGALGPATPGMRSRLRSWVSAIAGGLRGQLDDWIAAIIARRERQAAIFALRHFSDRELKDIGLHRDGIACGAWFSERKPLAGVGDTASFPGAVKARR